MHRSIGNRFVWMMLLAGWMLLTCQPPPPGFPARFARDRQRVYLGLWEWHDNQNLHPGKQMLLVNLAVWNGDRQAWQFVKNHGQISLPEDVTEALTRVPDTYPRVACAPKAPQVCLRIPHVCSDIVEISRDGGATWDFGWRIPPRRRDFFWRAQRWPLPLKFVTVPYGICALDVIWVSSSDGDTYAFVTLGGEGLLVYRSPDQWHRQGLASATPTPLRLSAIEALIFVMPESLLIVLLAPWLSYLLVSRRSHDGVASGFQESFRKAAGFLKWVWIVGAAAWLLLGMAFWDALNAWVFISDVLLYTACLLLGVAGLLHLWGWAALLMVMWMMGAAGRWLVLLHGVLMVFVLGLWLWAMGVWPLTYGETLALTLFLLVFTGWKVFSLLPPGAEPADPSQRSGASKRF